MISIIELIYFLLGILFINHIIPILDAITTTFVNAIGIINTWCLTKVYKYKAEIQKYEGETEKIHSHAIGFEVSSNTEEDEDDF